MYNTLSLVSKTFEIELVTIQFIKQNCRNQYSKGNLVTKSLPSFSPHIFLQWRKYNEGQRPLRDYANYIAKKLLGNDYRKKRLGKTAV